MPRAPDRMQTPRRKAKIQSLLRADAILAAIASAPDGRIKLSELSAKLGLHKNTAFSLLETLRALGYVDQVQSRQYRLGHRFFELARLSEADVDIVQQARPIMLRMVALANESSSLGVPATNRVLIISTIESSQGVRGARYSGRHSPYHASAIGKAILAFLPAAERDAVLAIGELERLTPKTLTSKQTLVRHLEEVARRGYALSLEEEELGANAVAVPLLSRMGEVVGALAIWGPAPRLTRDRLAGIGGRLMKETAHFPSEPP